MHRSDLTMWVLLTSSLSEQVWLISTRGCPFQILIPYIINAKHSAKIQLENLWKERSPQMQVPFYCQKGNRVVRLKISFSSNLLLSTVSFLGLHREGRGDNDTCRGKGPTEHHSGSPGQWVPSTHDTVCAHLEHGSRELWHIAPQEGDGPI